MMLFAGARCACFLLAALQRAAAVRDSFNTDRLLAEAQEVEQDEFGRLAHRTASEGLAQTTQARGKATDFRMYDLVQFYDEKQKMWILAVVALVIPDADTIEVIYTERTAGDGKTFAGQDEIEKLQYVEVDLPDGWQTQRATSRDENNGRVFYASRSRSLWKPPVPRKTTPVKPTTPAKLTKNKQVDTEVNQACKVKSSDGNLYTAKVIHPQGQVVDDEGRLWPQFIRVEYTEGRRYEASKKMMEESEGLNTPWEKKGRVEAALRKKRRAMDPVDERDSIQLEDMYMDMAASLELQAPSHVFKAGQDARLWRQNEEFERERRRAEELEKIKREAEELEMKEMLKQKQAEPAQQVAFDNGQEVMVLSQRKQTFYRARVTDNAIPPEQIKNWYKEKYQAAGRTGWIAIEYLEGPAVEEWEEWNKTRRGPEPTKIRHIRPNWNVNIKAVEEGKDYVDMDTPGHEWREEAERARKAVAKTRVKSILNEGDDDIHKLERAVEECIKLGWQESEPIIMDARQRINRHKQPSAKSRPADLRLLSVSQEIRRKRHGKSEGKAQRQVSQPTPTISTPQSWPEEESRARAMTVAAFDPEKMFQDWVVRELNNATEANMQTKFQLCKDAATKKGFDMVSMLPRLHGLLTKNARKLLQQTAEEEDLREAVEKLETLAVESRKNSVLKEEERLREEATENFKAQIVSRAHAAQNEEDMIEILKWCQAKELDAEEILQPEARLSPQNNLLFWKAVIALQREQQNEYEEKQEALKKSQADLPPGGTAQIEFHNYDTGAIQSNPPRKKVAASRSSLVRPPPPRAREAIEYKARYDYTAQDSRELSFEKGNIIDITSQQGDWWMGRKRGGFREGYVPSNYLEAIRTRSRRDGLD